MKVRLISFTDRGQALAQRLAEALHGESCRCNRPMGLSQWTEQSFQTSDALIFVGAAGIAVRAVAPYVKSKVQDPAVVVVDECGAFVVPILSGHLGGANDLAREIAEYLEAVPVITTATDRNGVFSVDAWARLQGCAAQNPERIKAISARLLRGKTVTLRSDWPIMGPVPEGVRITEQPECDVRLSIHTSKGTALYIVPKIAVVGLGCKKGTDEQTIEQVFQELLDREHISEKAVCGVCSIDLKREEPGLLRFSQSHGLPFAAFSAQELQAVPGDFTPSDFVKKTTGVDNVCERSAVLGSGGSLYVKKLAKNGVTMAVALKPFSPDWRWQYE